MRAFCITRDNVEAANGNGHGRHNPQEKGTRTRGLER